MSIKSSDDDTLLLAGFISRQREQNKIKYGRLLYFLRLADYLSLCSRLALT